jgi:hypothetical protein
MKSRQIWIFLWLGEFEDDEEWLVFLCWQFHLPGLILTIETVIISLNRYSFKIP